RRLLDGGARMQTLRGENAKIAGGDLLRIASRVQPYGEIRCAADPKSGVADRARMLFRHIVGMDLHTGEASEVCGKDTAQRATADNADFHWHSIPQCTKRKTITFDPRSIQRRLTRLATRVI